MRLCDAKLCVDCDEIWDDTQYTACPRCASSFSIRLNPVMNPDDAKIVPNTGTQLKK